MTERMERLYEVLQTKEKEFRAAAQEEVTAEILKERTDRRESLLKHWGVTRVKSLTKEGRIAWGDYDKMYERAMRFLPVSVERRAQMKLDAWCEANRFKY